MEHSHNPDSNSNSQSWLSSRTGIVTIVVVSILGFLIYQGHGAHLLGYAPFLLILACPLMHIFMHGGHGGHGGEQNDGAKEEVLHPSEVQQGTQTADTQKNSQQASNSNQPQHQHKGGCH
ncbi:MAG: DUF2933 domain-containing protein [Rickettsiales bacterium]|nr:DUF2933 domain-containing protein [Rickettsiales bacterium]